MEVKSRAIVLRSLKYGEAQMIVDLLTRAQGRVSFICRLSKSGKGRAHKQLFQPLNLLTVCYDFRANANLQRFRDISLGRPFVSIPYDPYKLSIVMFIAEFLSHALRAEQQDELLFDYVESSLEWLDAASAHFANFHLAFMMHLSRFIGFYPNVDGYAAGAWFDLREGVFTRLRPSHPDCLAPADAERMVQLLRMDFNNMHLFKMGREDRNRCTEAILLYYRLHVPNFPELKSFEVMRTLF